MDTLLSFIVLGAMIYGFIRLYKSGKEERKAKDAKYEYLGEDGESLVDREDFFSAYDRYLEKYEEKFDKLKVEGTHKVLDESEKSHCSEKLKIVNIIMPKKAGEWGIFETNTRDFKIYWKGGKSKLSSIILVGKIGKLSAHFTLSVLKASDILMTEEFYLELSNYIHEISEENDAKFTELCENYRNHSETGDDTALRIFISKAVPLIKDSIRRKDIPGKFQYGKDIYFVKSDFLDDNPNNSVGYVYSIGIIPKSVADTYEEPEVLKTQFKNSQWEKLLKIFENHGQNLDEQKVVSDALNEANKMHEMALEMKTKLENEIKRRETVEDSKKEN